MRSVSVLPENLIGFIFVMAKLKSLIKLYDGGIYD